MSLSHPCIVRFIGVCLADKDGSPMMLVRNLHQVTWNVKYSRCHAMNDVDVPCNQRTTNFEMHVADVFAL